MTAVSHEVFLSYSRKDNVRPVNAAGHGWVKAFKLDLERRHRERSGRELQIFFDQEEIATGVDWRRRLGEGLRSSKLFLAFLTPNYLLSENCLWEWDEYLRREHSAARGDDGLTPVFFVRPDDLTRREDQQIADWLAEMERKYPWFQVGSHAAAPGDFIEPFVEDVVRRRNRTHQCELHPWFDAGPQVLHELDAAARAAELRAEPRDPAADVRTLAERLAALDRHISRRLDRIALADMAPGNVARSHEHFVGRHRELRQLHDIMLTGGPQSGGKGMGGRGMIAAAFSPGGLGKTALARQYAHAYAEFYAAGGVWEIPCEGVSELGAALLKLADSEAFRSLAVLGFDVEKQQPRNLTQPLQLTDDQRADFDRAGEAILDYLKRVTEARKEVLLDKLRTLPDRRSAADDPPELQRPRALLILDNVDKTELLAAAGVAKLPAEEWLEIIVTTRLDPSRFGGERTFAHVEVSVLPIADAVRLLADFQPGRRFANVAEEEAAKEIAAALGGWTIAIEITAAYLGDLSRTNHTAPAAEFLKKLHKEGLAWIDDLAALSAFDVEQRHSEAKNEAERKRQNRVGTLIRWSLERLSPPARTALQFAAVMMPDEIPLPWLQFLTTNERHPEAKDNWPAVWRELRGLRLLHPSREVEPDERGVEQIPLNVRIHRLTAEHVAESDADSAQRWRELDQFLDSLSTMFEQQVGRGNDVWLRAQHPWLRDQLRYLIDSGECTPSLLSSAGVAASFEGEHGSLAQAIEFTQQILVEKENIFGTNPESTLAARDVSVSLLKLADFLARRGLPGDAEQALEHYERSLEISERLLAANPESAAAARDVSVSLNKLADFLASRGLPGDAEQALRHYERDLEISERLLAANPESAAAARDVFVSLIKLGDFLTSRGLRGDAEQALAHYERGLEVAERLLVANPESAAAARDVSVSLNKLADFLASRGLPGDAAQALAHYKRGLEVRKRLLAANPDSAVAARDVSVSLNKLADFLARRGLPGDAAQALEHYRRSLEICERLLAANPESAAAARDVTVSLNKLADFLAGRGLPGDAEQALAHYERGLEVSERLLAANPESAAAARDMMISLERLSAAASNREGGAEEALKLQLRALEIALQLQAANPRSVYFGRTLAVSFILASRRGHAVGNEELATKCLAGCFTTLGKMIQAEVELDTAMRNLHAQLQPLFSRP